MNDAEYQVLWDFLQEQRKREYTKEEALRSFVNAGILDTDGNFTEQFKDLEPVFARF